MGSTMDRGDLELEGQKASPSKSKQNQKSKQPSPVLPWTLKTLFSFNDFLLDHARRPDGSLNRRLLEVFDYRVAASPRSSTVPTHDIVVDAARRLWFRLYIPKAAVAGNSTGRQLPLVVFFHGGGFAFGSAASSYFNALCRRLSRAIPAIVISVNYRRSPEHRFPAPYDDGYDVLRFVDNGIGNNAAAGSVPAAVETLFRVTDLSRCFLAGDSAGGNIAHHVARRWTATDGPVAERLRLAGLVLLQPFFGGEERVDSEIRITKAPLLNTERTDWLWRLFLPDGANRDHEAANVFGLMAGKAEELGENFPPAVVAIGGFDPLQDWQTRYVNWLKERGKKVRMIDYPQAIHGFYAFPCLPEAGMVMEEIKSFVNHTGETKQV